jgi:hypothetical protein
VYPDQGDTTFGLKLVPAPAFQGHDVPQAESGNASIARQGASPGSEGWHPRMNKDNYPSHGHYCSEEWITTARIWTVLQVVYNQSCAS